MASFAFTNGAFTLNSVDLSAFVRSVEIQHSGDLVEDTAMGDTHRSRVSGLKDTTWTVELNQDFAASGPDATINALVAGSAVTATAKPVNTTTAATNPQYSQSVIVQDYNPIAGSVGDLATCTVTLVGTGSLSRATS